VQGLVPEFVNPKYADASKTKFKKPTRLECMMQEHPKVLGPESKVGFTTFPDWTYLPVKNSVDEARAKIAVGAPGRTAAEGELDYYDAALRQLASLGVPSPAPGTVELFGFKLKEPAHVVLHPNFAHSYAQLKAHFPHPDRVRISSRSTLVVDGADVTIDSLDVDGALVIKAAPGAKVHIKAAKAHNAGWALVPLGADEKVPDSIRIRGFRVERHEQRVIEFTAPGVYTVEA